MYIFVAAWTFFDTYKFITYKQEGGEMEHDDGYLWKFYIEFIDLCDYVYIVMIVNVMCN